jgi:hypothetical protein
MKTEEVGVASACRADAEYYVARGGDATGPLSAPGDRFKRYRQGGP